MTGLSSEELDAIRQRHQPIGSEDPYRACRDGCGPWPCDASVALGEVDRLTAERDAAMHETEAALRDLIASTSRAHRYRSAIEAALADLAWIHGVEKIEAALRAVLGAGEPTPKCTCRLTVDGGEHITVAGSPGVCVVPGHTDPRLAPAPEPEATTP